MCSSLSLSELESLVSIHAQRLEDLTRQAMPQLNGSDAAPGSLFIPFLHPPAQEEPVASTSYLPPTYYPASLSSSQPVSFLGGESSSGVNASIDSSTRSKHVPARNGLDVLAESAQ